MVTTRSDGTSPSAPWQNRIVGHADVAPADLVPNPRNWRTHPGDQQRALAGALGEVGWVAEVLVNRTTGHVVDGHLRVELALARREPTVPVTYVELSDEEERLVLASPDPLAAMATAEASALASLLAELDPADDALRAVLDDLAREYALDAGRAGLVDPTSFPNFRRSRSSPAVPSTSLATTDSCAATVPTPPTSLASPPAIWRTASGPIPRMASRTKARPSATSGSATTTRRPRTT